MSRSLHMTLVLLLLGLPSWGWAQRLTPAQNATLKNDILVVNSAEFSSAVAQSDWQFIADAYNAQAAPMVWVWKSSLSEKSVYEDTSPDGTVWNWTTYIGQSVQERDGWARLYNPGPINPSLPQVRGAYDKIFGGTGASAAQRAHLLALSRRTARRVEAVLRVTTGGDGSTANPGTMSFEGTVSYYDIFYCITMTP